LAPVLIFLVGGPKNFKKDCRRRSFLKFKGLDHAVRERLRGKMKSNFRMAYPTGANLTAALLQQLNFRSAGNYPISSLYTLYANGNGLTYWSNSVNPTNISSLSTSIGNVYTQVEADLQTAILSTNAATSTLIDYYLGNFSEVSSQLSTLTYISISSFTGIQQNEAALSTNMNQLSTGINTAFLSTANSFQIQLDSYYQSTMNASQSTINSISSISSFYSQIQSTTNLTQAGLSSLSTALYTQNTSTYNSLLNIINTGLTSTATWTALQISSFSSIIVSIEALNNFSTQINNALLSTSANIQSTLTGDGNILAKHDIRISSLEAFSTNISSVTHGWISSFYSTNIYSVNQYMYNQSTLLGSTIKQLNAFSTLYHYDISCLTASTNANTYNISDLSYQFSIITTSSILAGIYETFIELEGYTQSTISTQAAANIAMVSTSVYTAVSTTIQDLYGVSTITLNSTTFYTELDFKQCLNYNIQLYNIADTSVYRVSYNSNLPSGASYQGLITIDISTIGQTYTQNNNVLCLDLSRWGIVNNNYQNTFPMIGDSDYTIEYEYNILNNCIYTNLLNIYPRINTTFLNVSSLQDNTDLSGYSQPIFSTGTQFLTTWNNYLFSTFGVSNYVAQVNVEITLGIGTTNIINNLYGPYEWPISSAIIAMPSYPAANTEIAGTIQTYIVGQKANTSISPIYYYAY